MNPKANRTKWAIPVALTLAVLTTSCNQMDSKNSQSAFLSNGDHPFQVPYEPGGSGPFPSPGPGNGGGTGGGGGRPTFGSGNNGFVIQTNGSDIVVARCETDVPADDLPFLFQCSIPLPVGEAPRSDGRQPFAVRSGNGTQVLAAVEQVTRYAKWSDGYSIGNIVAPVVRHPNQPTRQSFEIVKLANPQPFPTYTPDLLSTVFQSLQFSAETSDVFGHTYRLNLLDPAQVSSRSYRPSPYREVRRHAGSLESPDSKGPPSGALEGILNVVAHFTADSTLPQGITVDLLVHNANVDQPNLDVYFRNLRLQVGGGFTLDCDYPQHMQGTPLTSGGSTTLDLVLAQSNGALHLMREATGLSRRCMIFVPGFLEKARDRARDLGVAWNQAGTTGTGLPYYSWWNPGITIPQIGDRLARLSANGVNNYRALVQGDLLKAAQTMETGVGTSSYYKSAIGYVLNADVDIGYETGGGGIEEAAAGYALLAGTREGLALFRIQERYMQDRRKMFLTASGDPAHPWKIRSQEGFVPFEINAMLDTPRDRHDPFGYNSLSRFQIDAVANQGKVPSYESALQARRPYDYQHAIRDFRQLVALALLGDASAQDQVRSAAARWMLYFNRHPRAPGWQGNTEYNFGSGSAAYVTAHPHSGAPALDRAGAWGQYVSNLSWMLRDSDTDQTATEYRGHFDWVTWLAANAINCQGIFGQKSPNAQSGLTNPLDYVWVQSFEESFVQISLWGLLHAYYINTSNTVGWAQLANTLGTAMVKWGSPFRWDSSENRPFAMLATAPAAHPETPFCSNEPPPAVTRSINIDIYLPSVAARGMQLFSGQAEMEGSFLNLTAINRGLAPGEGCQLRPMFETNVSNTSGPWYPSHRLWEMPMLAVLQDRCP